jgi:hypothetical protein
VAARAGLDTVEKGISLAPLGNLTSNASAVPSVAIEAKFCLNLSFRALRIAPCGALAGEGQARVKAILVTGRAGTLNCETPRLPPEVVILTGRPFFTRRKIRDLVDSKAIMQLVGLVQ